MIEIEELKKQFEHFEKYYKKMKIIEEEYSNKKYSLDKKYQNVENLLNPGSEFSVLRTHTNFFYGEDYECGKKVDIGRAIDMQNGTDAIYAPYKSMLALLPSSDAGYRSYLQTLLGNKVSSEVKNEILQLNITQKTSYFKRTRDKKEELKSNIESQEMIYNEGLHKISRCMRQQGTKHSYNVAAGVFGVFMAISFLLFFVSLFIAGPGLLVFSIIVFAISLIVVICCGTSSSKIPSLAAAKGSVKGKLLTSYKMLQADFYNFYEREVNLLRGMTNDILTESCKEIIHRYHVEMEELSLQHEQDIQEATEIYQSAESPNREYLELFYSLEEAERLEFFKMLKFIERVSDVNKVYQECKNLATQRKMAYYQQAQAKEAYQQTRILNEQKAQQEQHHRTVEQQNKELQRTYDEIKDIENENLRQSTEAKLYSQMQLHAQYSANRELDRQTKELKKQTKMMKR